MKRYSSLVLSQRVPAGVEGDHRAPWRSDPLTQSQALGTKGTNAQVWGGDSALPSPPGKIPGCYILWGIPLACGWTFSLKPRLKLTTGKNVRRQFITQSPCGLRHMK